MVASSFMQSPLLPGGGHRGAVCGINRLLLFLLLFIFSCLVTPAGASDDYTIDPNNKSLLVALGCFWCAEQAFELYAPGVVEAVSGYAGGRNDNPTYRNHPGHYEVILIEYDPSKTSYETLVEYAWRNLDPFDGIGQFCDKGTSYRPAIFYANEDEREIADRVRSRILETKQWDEVMVPNAERPGFWTAEGYHQDFYIKKPNDYAYYKSRCGRTNRLKEVWGEEEYYCYHSNTLGCFNRTVVNEEGTVVDAEVNRKNAPEEKENPHPPVKTILGIVFVSLVGACVLALLFRAVWRGCDGEADNNGEVAGQKIPDVTTLSGGEEQEADEKI